MRKPGNGFATEIWLSQIGCADSLGKQMGIRRWRVAGRYDLMDRIICRITIHDFAQYANRILRVLFRPMETGYPRGLGYITTHCGRKWPQVHPFLSSQLENWRSSISQKQKSAFKRLPDTRQATNSGSWSRASTRNQEPAADTGTQASIGTTKQTKGGKGQKCSNQRSAFSFQRVEDA